MTTFADICVSVFRVPKQRRNKAPPSTFKKVASELMALRKMPPPQDCSDTCARASAMSTCWSGSRAASRKPGAVPRGEGPQRARYRLSGRAGSRSHQLACRQEYAAGQQHRRSRLPLRLRGGSGGGTSSGEEIDVARSGIIAFSPCSAAELTAVPDVPPPNANELDYALLRLSRRPAQAADGWI